jgi:hypothetical protein
MREAERVGFLRGASCFWKGKEFIMSRKELARVDGVNAAVAVVENSVALRPRQALAVGKGLPALPVEALPEMVTEQWHRAQEGLLEILRFGAMMIEVGNVIQLDKIHHRGQHSKGNGLQGWLSEHCPTVHYQTAMGYMRAAQGLVKMLELREETPLLQLMGGDVTQQEAEEGLHEKIMVTLAGSSLRLLKEAGRENDRPLGRPRGSGKGETRPPVSAHDQQAMAEEGLVECYRKLAAYVVSHAYYLVPLEKRREVAKLLRSLAKDMEE